MIRKIVLSVAFTAIAATVSVSALLLLDEYSFAQSANQCGPVVTEPLTSKDAEVDPALDINAFQGGDGIFRDINRELPGFGGLYREGDILYVVMTDRAPIAVISSVLANHGISGNIQVIPGCYSFNHLLFWKLKLRQFMEEKRYAIGALDVDEVKNRVGIGLTQMDEETLAALKAKLKELDIPLEAVYFSSTGPVILLDWRP